MPSGSPLRYRDLLAKLKRFGVEESRRGKGSRRMLYKRGIEGLDQSYPIHPHSENAEIHVHIIRTILRRFKIPEEGFWEA